MSSSDDITQAVINDAVTGAKDITIGDRRISKYTLKERLDAQAAVDNADNGGISLVEFSND